MKKLALLLMLFGANCLTIGCAGEGGTEEAAPSTEAGAPAEGSGEAPSEEAPAE